MLHNVDRSLLFMIVSLCFRWVRRKKYGIGDGGQYQERVHALNGLYLNYDYSKGGGRSSNSSVTSTDVTFTEVELEYSKSNHIVKSGH